MEALVSEAEGLRDRLADERQRLTNYIPIEKVAEKISPIVALYMKTRRHLKGHQQKVLCIDWSSDKHHLVSASQDGKVIVWNAFTTHKVHALSMTSNWIMTCAYAPSGNLIACGGLDNRITVFPLSLEDNISAKKQLVAAHINYVSCCAFMRSDSLILTGSGDATCAAWDIDSEQMIRSFPGHRCDVLSLDIPVAETNTNIFISAGADKQVLVWDIRTGKCVQSFDGHDSDINCVRFHPNGDVFSTASDDATCRLYDLRADSQISTYASENVIFPINSVDFSVGGRLLFAGSSDYTAIVWDILKCHRVSVLRGHENRVSSLRTSRDGTAVATASWDSTIRVWA